MGINLKKMKETKWFLPAAAATVLILVAFLAFRGYGGKHGPVPTEPKGPLISGLETAVVQPVAITDFNETSGSVKARSVSVLAAKVMGAVTEVKVRQGDRVAAGQLLLAIDADDISRQLESAAHQKELADVTAARYRSLFAANAISRQQLDEVETRRKVADAEYSRAAANLAFARITAPFAGVVTDRRIDPGSMASPGMHLLTVEDISSFSIETQADERLINRIAVGMPVEVAIESIGRSVTGRVVEASPSVDPVSHTFYVKVEMADPALRSGLYAKVRFPLGQRQALLVPADSIVSKGQLTGVYVADEKGLLSYRLIKTGKQTSSGIEILSGISTGDRLVVKGAKTAVDGGRMAEVKSP